MFREWSVLESILLENYEHCGIKNKQNAAVSMNLNNSGRCEVCVTSQTRPFQVLTNYKSKYS